MVYFKFNIITMALFNATCKIIEDGKEVDYPLFVNAIDVPTAFAECKRFMIEDRPEIDFIRVDTVRVLN